MLGCPNNPDLLTRSLSPAALIPSSKPIKAKTKCCKDKPRCKRCPVVCKRLAEAGYLERLDKRRYVVVDVVPKAALKAARKRG